MPKLARVGTVNRLTGVIAKMISMPNAGNFGGVNTMQPQGNPGMLMPPAAPPMMQLAAQSNDAQNPVGGFVPNPTQNMVQRDNLLR